MSKSTKPPPPPSDETARSIWTSFLLFMGPLIGGGGLLAMLRTQERDLFFALMMPVGIVMWFVGFMLKHTGGRDQ